MRRGGRGVGADTLAGWVCDARQRSLALVGDLSDEQLLGARLGIVNPLLWEIGHVAWFQERWALRHALGEPPLRADADALWDSTAIPHDVRWDLPLPPRAETLAYVSAVRDRLLEALARRGDDHRLLYFTEYAVYHEDMHGEAFATTRQTLGYPPPPRPGLTGAEPAAGEAVRGDARVPGGSFELGARPDERFVLDNEKWAHPVALRPFAIARAPVTQAEFAAFVEDGGYRRREWWSEAGWRWREGSGARAPVYWRPAAGGGFERRVFDRWLPLAADLPAEHVCFHETEAYCAWANRRLPTEAEWEAAAAGVPDGRGGLRPEKRRFPWGDAPPSPRLGNLDGAAGGTVAVHACAEGDSAFGCRQLLGNVWEWTASDFAPYPGFEPDPYKEYSQPWFHTHKVLRGGAWATRGRLLRNTWRNFYEPHRRDVLAGFRTCAREG